MEPIKLQSLWMPAYTNIRGVAGQTFTLGEKGITSIVFHPDNDWVEFEILGKDGKKSRALVSFDGCVASPLEGEAKPADPEKYPSHVPQVGVAASPPKKPILPQTDEFKASLAENVKKAEKEFEEDVKKFSKPGKKRGRPKKK